MKMTSLENSINKMEKVHEEVHEIGLRLASRGFGAFSVWVGARMYIPALTARISGHYNGNYLLSLFEICGGIFILEGMGDVISGEHHYISRRVINCARKGIK